MVIYIFTLIGGFLTFILGMVLVAFFILTERKILGYIQLRKGPNKVGFLGLLQSFADLIKLVIKFKVMFFQHRSWFSLFGIFLFLLNACLYCFFLSFSYFDCGSNVSLLYLLVISSLGGYSILSIGWGSYNKFGLLSSIRCCFGAISFEALFICVIILVATSNSGYSIFELIQYGSFFFLILPVLFFFWCLCLLCECGRVPFDYHEAESEMVSGINVEYSGVSFTCLFACEYFIMFILSWLTSVIFFGGVFIIPLTLFTLFFFVWSRGTFPRARYNYFVSIIWSMSLVVCVYSFFVVL